MNDRFHSLLNHGCTLKFCFVFVFSCSSSFFLIMVELTSLETVTPGRLRLGFCLFVICNGESACDDDYDDDDG